MVLKKLMAARLQLHGMGLEKTGENKFAGYKYFELGDFLVPAQKIFAELDLCGVVSFTADVATLTITDLEDGTSVQITSPMGSASLKGCHEVQNIGAVETYQRRYLWVAAFEIVEHDALDATTGKAKTEPQAKSDSKPGQPLDGVWEALTPEDQGWFLEFAATVIQTNKKNGIEAVVDLIEKQEPKFSPDDMAALWVCLKSESALRTAINKETRKRKEQAE